MAELPTTDSGIEIQPLYAADDMDGWDPATKLGAPGSPPYTRGVYSSMYTGRLWTMRQYSGFSNAEATNERFKFLLNAGQTGSLVQESAEELVTERSSRASVQRMPSRAADCLPASSRTSSKSSWRSSSGRASIHPRRASERMRRNAGSSSSASSLKGR